MKVLRAVFLVLLVVLVAAVAVYLYRVVTCPYPLEFCEGVVLLEGKLLASGQGLYRDVNAIPYVITAWTPLYFTFLAPIIHFFGDGFAPARTLTLLFTLLSAAMIALAAVRAGAHRYWAAVFALLWLLQPETLYWGALVRIDSMALFFSLAAVYLYLSPRPALPAVGLLLCLAFLTKQSSVAAAAAVLLHAGWSARRVPISLLAWFLLPAALAAAVLQLSSAGAFLFSTFTFHRLTGLDPGPAVLMLKSYAALHFPLLLLMMIALVLMLSSREAGREKGPAVSALYLAILALQTVMIFKKGASHNYFLEPNAAMSILGAYFFTFLFSEHARSLRTVAALAAVLLVLQVGYTWGGRYLFTLVGSAARSFQGQVPERFKRVSDEDAQALRVIGKFKDPVWCENVGLLLAGGRDVLMGEPWEYSVLPPERWRSDRIRAMLSRGELSLVVLGDRNLPDVRCRLTQWMAQDLVKYYRPYYQAGPYLFLVPKGSPAKLP